MLQLSRYVRHVTCGLAAVLALQAPVVHAGMIGPEAVVANSAPSQAEQDRLKVQQFLETATLKERLRTMGVDGLTASQRVEALSQEEVHALAQKIDSLPAGGAMSERDIILIVLLTLLLIIVL